ncbi:MAG: 4Fe-4S binding protein [Clostridiaceae bacterium]|nr:4Fe-4S binding protein [Clostridiaceae bacterium]
MLYETGIAGSDLIESVLPSAERRAKGPYAVIECFQEIPCNPCSDSCPFDAILPLEDINELPQLVPDLCTGCGICAGVCPGLAIFIIDESRGDGMATLSIPYEFLPLPQKDDLVAALDRSGAYVTDARVARVQRGRKGGTPLVTLSLPLDLVHEVRFFRAREAGDGEPLAMTGAETEDSQPMDEDAILCRCEGLTLGEVRQLIAEGYTTLDEIKRISRAGMGPCQARTCGPLIAREISRMTGIPLEEVEPSAHRPPVKSLPLSFFMEDADVTT